MKTETIVQFTKRDQRTFKAIFDEYSAYMLVFAKRYVSQQDAYDVVQEVFLLLWNCNIQFTSSTSVKSWLFTSVKNQCLNILRRDDINSRYLQSLTEEDFEENILDTELYTILYKAINKLPAHYKITIEMSLNGKKTEEIAQELDTTVDAVKAYKKRGKEMLRKYLIDVYGIILVEIFLSNIN